MTPPLITLTTDFGAGSPYVAQMKGVILSIHPPARLIDVSHTIPPQDVRTGAIVLAEVAPRFPAGTIHVAVVDPQVGAARKILCAAWGGQRFILPDNGLLDRLAALGPLGEVRSVENRHYWLPEVSATFHGRDIMAPVAAHLSRGVPPAELGPVLPADARVRLDWPAARLEADAAWGEVLYADSFGNLVTNLDRQTLAALCGLPAADGPLDEPPKSGTLTVQIAGRTIPGIVRTYADRRPGELAALIGSGGLLEVAVVQGSALATLGAGAGTPVCVRRGGASA